MSVFLLPASLCEDIERMMNKYWWGNGGDQSHGIHWKKWDKICVKKYNGGLGFRKMMNFNVAMLAKQGWRLITKPMSLVARILKARYYPNTSFLNAGTGHSPSHTWRSLISTQNLIKCGLRRRIGNGQQTKIWHVPWLNEEPDPYIQSDPPEGYDSAPVSLLIDPFNHYWDVEAIDALLPESEKKRNLHTPVSRMGAPDTWRWAPNPKGQYTVKSGYNTLMAEAQNQDLPVVTNWQKLLQIDAPPKLKNLIWRTLSNCLPSLTALSKKKVEVDTTCVVCKQVDEDAGHVVYNCSFAKNVWAGTKAGNQAAGKKNVIEWWNGLISRNKPEEINEAAFVIWCLWKHRNTLTWHGKSEPVTRIIQQANNMHVLWKCAHQRQPTATKSNTAVHNSGNSNDQSVMQRWKKPTLGSFKCNVDASLDVANSKMGFGCIIRNSEGIFIVAKQGSFEGNYSPNIVEAIGVREALSWVKSQELEKICIEMDSQTIAVAINKEDEDNSVMGLIIQDCISLKQDINQCTVSFVRRSTNVAAHTLDRVALSMPGQECWDLSPPSFISDVLYADLS